MKLQNLALSVLIGGSLAWSGLSLAQSQPMTPAPQGGAAAQQQKDQLDGDDQDFLENAAQAGHTEIEGSKLAQAKSKSPDVKQFAEQMIADHTKVAEELATLAKSKGYTPPTEPSLVQKAKLKTLDMSDESFDKRYADQIGVSAHEDAVKLFEEAAKDAKDPEIKAFAAKTLPSLQKHLEMGKALQQKVGGGDAAQKK